METKLQNLVKQVGTDVSGKWIATERVEQLAELIVQECASKVDWILAEDGKTQGDLIKEHFGME